MDNLTGRPVAGLLRRALACLGTIAWGAATPLLAQGRDALEPYTQTIEGTLVTFEMMPVPGGTVQMRAGDGTREVRVAPFWMSRTEVSWDLYDVYVFGLDNARPGVDAVARPSKPYVLPGEQFGHQGHPALGMTHKAATQFAAWLSARTGVRYRLPTDAEWELACRTGQQGIAAADAPHAWTAETAAGRTHRVGTSAADALGLHDMRGNAGEWVDVAGDEPVVMGGAFNDADDAAHCGARRRQTAAWNASDPQLPKSEWWLSDAPFVGLRLVRER